MKDPRRAGAMLWTPGTWSTDDYIRRWASLHADDVDECVVPLQSLHGCWVARVSLRESGQPVERLREAGEADTPDGLSLAA